MGFTWQEDISVGAKITAAAIQELRNNVDYLKDNECPTHYETVCSSFCSTVNDSADSGVELTYNSEDNSPDYGTHYSSANDTVYLDVDNNIDSTYNSTVLSGEEAVVDSTHDATVDSGDDTTVCGTNYSADDSGYDVTVCSTANSAVDDTYNSTVYSPEDSSVFSTADSGYDSSYNYSENSAYDGQVKSAYICSPQISSLEEE